MFSICFEKIIKDFWICNTYRWDSLKFGLFKSACSIDGLSASDHLHLNLIPGDSVTSSVSADGVEVEIEIPSSFEGVYNLCAMQDGWSN